jgi:hypothetical protein
MGQGASAVCTAALILALCTVAAAQAPTRDPELVGRPDWSLGDWWEYRNNDDSRRWRLTVVATRTDGYTLAESRVGEIIQDGAGRRRFLFDRDGHVTMNIDAAGKSTEPGDKRQYVKFPLALGNRWFFHAMLTQVGKPPTEFYMYDFDCRAEAWETLDIGGRSVRAVRIAVASGQRGNIRPSNQTAWYAPAAKRIVRLVSTYAGGPSLNMIAFGSAADSAEVVVAAPPPPPASTVQTPPQILVLDPKPGTLHRSEHVPLKVEIKAPNRLRSLIVRGAGPEQNLTPNTAAKPGEPWIAETKVTLAEGANVIQLEALDELGTRAVASVGLSRESLVAVDFAGPPGTAVRIEQDEHTLDASGRLVLHMPPGRYRVDATKKGFIPLRQSLVLSPGQGKATQQLALVEIVAPVIAILAPAPGALHTTPDVRLRVEVRSRYRLNSLRLDRGGTGGPQTFTPPGGGRIGEPWIIETIVALAEGDNALNLRAIDEHGIHTEQKVTVTRRSLISVDLRGPPGTQIKIDNGVHRLDAQGTLTLQLPPGTYPIEGSKEGFVPWRDIITLTAGQRSAGKTLALTPLPQSPIVVAPPADTEPPKIAINYPATDAQITVDAIVILGLVSDNVAVDRVQITVNGAEVQSRDLAVVGRGVPIRVAAALLPGPNLIEITASDKAGNVAQLVRTVTRLAPAPIAKVANRWAVVIGVGEYEKRSIPPLRYARRDAEAMYQFLTTHGGYPKDHVVLLTDASPQKPTLINIKRALGDFLARRAGRDDMVLIYFAGHGAPELDAGGTEGDGLSKYLIPRDGDPESLYTTALPMDEIQKIFARVQAERIVMLLDTCYSGNAGGRTFARASVRASGLNDQFLERLTRSRGRVIITASGPNEVALEISALGHGLFTYHVLEALRGKADRNADGIVTVSELYEYVEEHVDADARRAGGRQRPLMKGEVEGTLPLSKIAR